MLDIVYGIIAGMMTGAALGGGTILILLLTNFSGIEQHIAQGINLVYFIPTSIIAIIVNLKQKKINIKTAFWVSIFGIIGAIFGSRVSIITNSKTLKRFFGIFLLIIALHESYILIKQYKNHKKRNNKRNKNIK